MASCIRLTSRYRRGGSTSAGQGFFRSRTSRRQFSGDVARPGKQPLHVGSTKPAQGAAVETALVERADVVGLRLSHENTYLSWSRNGIIATVAAVGIHSATVDEGRTGAQATAGRPVPVYPGVFMQAGSSTWTYHVSPPAAAMFGVAGTFFSFGTIQYMAQLSQLGPLLQLTLLRKVWMGSHALGVVCLWALGVRGFVLQQHETPQLPTRSVDHQATDAAGVNSRTTASQPLVSSVHESRGGSERGAAKGEYAVAALAITAAGLLTLLSGRARTS